MARTSKSSVARAAPDASPSLESMSYEQAMEEAQAITDRLDRGEIGLEESLAAFKRGMALLNRCREILDAAEQQVQQITASEMNDKESGDDGRR